MTQSDRRFSVSSDTSGWASCALAAADVPTMTRNTADNRDSCFKRFIVRLSFDSPLKTNSLTPDSTALQTGCLRHAVEETPPKTRLPGYHPDLISLRHLS